MQSGDDHGRMDLAFQAPESEQSSEVMDCEKPSTPTHPGNAENAVKWLVSYPFDSDDEGSDGHSGNAISESREISQHPSFDDRELRIGDRQILKSSSSTASELTDTDSIPY